MLSKEFQKIFRDFSSFEHPFALFSAPFSFDVVKAEESLQMEPLETLSDSSLRAKYFEVGIPDFFMHYGQVYEHQKVCHTDRGNVRFHLFV